MANSKQAKRRVKQARKRAESNGSKRSMLRTAIKKVVYALDANDQATAQAAYIKAIPVIDRMATNNIIHKNKAARHKSRLNARIKALAEVKS